MDSQVGGGLGAIDPGTGGPGVADLSIGGYLDAFGGTERLNGDIGEILLYGSSLSNQDLDSLVTYMQQRWFIPEPSSGVLAMLAMLGLIGRWRRCRAYVSVRV